jgi:hypothetical protein
MNQYNVRSLNIRSKKNQPIRLPGLILRLRSGQAARGMPLDKLKAPSTPRGSGLILSGAFYPDLKIGVCLRPELRPRVRRRTYQTGIEELS